MLDYQIRSLPLDSLLAFLVVVIFGIVFGNSMILFNAGISLWKDNRSYHVMQHCAFNLETKGVPLISILKKIVFSFQNATKQSCSHSWLRIVQAHCTVWIWKKLLTKLEGSASTQQSVESREKLKKMKIDEDMKTFLSYFYFFWVLKHLFWKQISKLNRF